MPFREIRGGAIDIGKCILEKFHDGDIERAKSKNPTKISSYKALCKHPELMVHPTTPGIMVRVAAQEKFFEAKGSPLIALSIPLLLGKIKMNRAYGFRNRKAFESEENWHLINRYGTKALIMRSLVIMAIGIVCLYIEPQHVLTVAKITFISLLVPIVQTLWYARQL